MKKLFVLIAALALSASVASAQDWAAGARVGSGFQGIAQRHFANSDYVELRLGMDWIYRDGLVADFSALYVWNVSKMYWSPEGTWFFDAGAGVNMGGKSRFFFAGIQGMAKLGYTFERTPLSIALDWSPTFGAGIEFKRGGYIDGQGNFEGNSQTSFNDNGLMGFGLSCIYRF